MYKPLKAPVPPLPDGPTLPSGEGEAPEPPVEAPLVEALPVEALPALPEGPTLLPEGLSAPPEGPRPSKTSVESEPAAAVVPHTRT